MGEDSQLSRTFGESRAVELTGKIMVTAIIVLFVVVVFVLFLHLYAKWFWWRVDQSAADPHQQQSRRRRRSRFVFAPGQDPTIGTLRKGLEPSILRSLPVLVYRPEDFKDGLECAVCLSELVQGEKARLLPKCNHGFHVDCIDMWFQSHSTCPICRNAVAPESSDDDDAATGSAALSGSVQDENLASGFSTETPNFPTNVLFWGNQTQVSSGVACLELEEGPSSQPLAPPSSSSSSLATSRPDGMLVIDIPGENSSAVSPSGGRFADEDLKSPVTTRLRSLKRLLSRDKRISPCSPSSLDIEQASRGQS